MYKKRSEEGEIRRVASLPRGKNHWKYDHYNVRAIHRWINRYHGKANRCVMPGCDGKSDWFEWALVKGKKYLRKIENFMPLCRKCHTKYDMTRKRKSAIVNGIKKRYKIIS